MTKEDSTTPPIRIESPGVSFIIKSGQDKRDLLRFPPAGTVLFRHSEV
jgi:hypothetical protein